MFSCSNMSLHAMSTSIYASPGPTVLGMCKNTLTSKALFLNCIPSLFFTFDPNLLLAFVTQPDHVMSHFCPVLPFGLCIFHLVLGTTFDLDSSEQFCFSPSYTA